MVAGWSSYHFSLAGKQRSSKFPLINGNICLLKKEFFFRYYLDGSILAGNVLDGRIGYNKRGIKS